MPATVASALPRHAVKIAIFAVVLVTLFLIAQRNSYQGPKSWGRPPPPPPGPPEHGNQPSGMGKEAIPGVTKTTSHDSRRDLFRDSFDLKEDFGPKKNLMVQWDVSHYGPWTIEPLPETIMTTENTTITFRCIYHEEMCPSRYIIMLRGSTITTVDTAAFKVDPKDKRIVTVDLNIPDRGLYKLYAWPDFEQCPDWWREKMRYPFTKAQVQGTPLTLRVTGPPAESESFEECSLNNALQLTHGRWVNRAALLPKYEKDAWVSSYPSDREWIWAPHNCKRRYRSWKDLSKTQSVNHIVWLGDSVSRGSFCSRVVADLFDAPRGKMPGDCKFGGQEWYATPKTLSYKRDGELYDEITLSFRFVFDHFREDFAATKASLPSNPSHIITNIGLWLTQLPIEDYPKHLQDWLDLLFAAWPHATFIFRTTTDVSPMIACYDDRDMYRIIVKQQRDIAGQVVPAMRKKGMRIYLVDAYSMTRARHDTGYDGRHWLVEDPNDINGVTMERPALDNAERAVVDALAEIVMLDDEEAVKGGRPKPPALTEKEVQEHKDWLQKQAEEEAKKAEEKARKAEEEAKKKAEEGKTN